MAKRKAQEKKPQKEPLPMVLGVRYCMACGRSLIAVYLDVARSVSMLDVGRTASPCCKAMTALLLIPTTDRVEVGAPNELAELRRVKAAP